jgi:ADP-heptose:LPS heptosyltransferase
MATPTIRAMNKFGFDVSVRVRGNYPDAYMLLEDLDFIEEVYTENPVHIKWEAVVPTVWGGGTDGLSFNSKLRCKKYTNPFEHEADLNFTAALRVGYTGKMPQPVCSYSKEMRSHKKYICICTGHGGKTKSDWVRKQWKYWDEFCNLVNLPIICVGAEDDYVPPKLHYSYMGTLNIKEAAGVLRYSQAVVALDSGLAHIAAAQEVPTFVLFGATSEMKNRPLGPDVSIITSDKCPNRPCQMTDRWNTCKDWVCMDIKPELVKSIIEKRLNTLL